MADESFWIARAQDAEATLATLRDQLEPLKQKVREVREALCAKERSDGTLVIDFPALAERLGVEGALELRKAIDECYGITGAAGEKPRMRVRAA